MIAGKPIAPSANSSGKFSVARQLGLGVSRIVIDAGHGGHDPGASAFGISEAELVLDVALRLEKLLLQQPGIEVVLTRRTNDYLSLDERTGDRQSRVRGSVSFGARQRQRERHGAAASKPTS